MTTPRVRWPSVLQVKKFSETVTVKINPLRPPKRAVFIDRETCSHVIWNIKLILTKRVNFFWMPQLKRNNSPKIIFKRFIADDISSSSGLRFPAPHTPPSNPLTPASPHTATGGGGSQGFLQSPPSIRQPSPAMPPHASPGLLDRKIVFEWNASDVEHRRSVNCLFSIFMSSTVA